MGAGNTQNFGAIDWGAELSVWQLDAVIEADVGAPFTPIIAGDCFRPGERRPHVDVPNLLAGPGSGSLVNPGIG